MWTNLINKIKKEEEVNPNYAKLERINFDQLDSNTKITTYTFTSYLGRQKKKRIITLGVALYASGLNSHQKAILNSAQQITAAIREIKHLNNLDDYAQMVVRKQTSQLLNQWKTHETTIESDTKKYNVKRVNKDFS